MISVKKKRRKTLKKRKGNIHLLHVVCWGFFSSTLSIRQLQIFISPAVIFSTVSSYSPSQFFFLPLLNAWIFQAARGSYLFHGAWLYLLPPPALIFLSAAWTGFIFLSHAMCSSPSYPLLPSSDPALWAVLPLSSMREVPAD